VIQVQYKLFPNDVVWLQALDTFNTAVVSPIYYAGFTSFTILASAIMFKVLLCAHAHGKRERVCVLRGCVFVCVCGGGVNNISNSSHIFSEGLFWSKCKQHCI
jgi:hypothetical protein